MSIAAYKQTIVATEDQRAIERRVIAQITRALEQHANDRPISKELKDALVRNQLLWSRFSGDAMLEGNELPLELRASLISLGIWVDRHTAAILGQNAEVQPLIDVNRMIMAGLGGNAANASI